MKNCKEIQNLFSEYLEGELDPGGRKLVEQHLENCPVCGEGLENLKECLKSLGSLPEAEPPPDFLYQIHARLEGESVCKSTIKKIIFPVHIKIPLEAAGLAAAALVLFYVLNISPVKQPVQPVAPEEALRIREEAVNSSTVTGARKSLCLQEEPMGTDRVHYREGLAVAGRVMEPAALPGEEPPAIKRAAPSSGGADVVGGGGAETVKLVLLIEPEAHSAGGKGRPAPPVLRMKGEELRRTEFATEDKENILPSPSLIRLKDLIAREGGEIISTEKLADSTRRLAIKLPPDHYRSFLEKLAGFTELQPFRPLRTEETEHTFRLRLTGLRETVR